MIPGRQAQALDLARRFRAKAEAVELRLDDLERTPLSRKPGAAPAAGDDRRLLRRLALGAAVIAALALTPRAWRAWQEARTPVLSFQPPLVEPAGLGLREGGLVSLDAARGLLFWLNRDDLSVREVEPFEAKTADALSWAQGELWTADLASGQVRRHASRPGRPVDRRSEDPYRSPSSLSAEGSSLWVLDAAAGTLDEYERGADHLTLRKRYPIDGFPATVAAVAGGEVWAADARSRMLKRYRFRVGGGLRETGSWALDGMLPKRGPAAGLVADETDVWLLTRRPAAVHRIRKSAL